MKLREIRKSQSLSIPKLSELSNVPVRTIEDIERKGECKVSTAIKLADALKVTLDELCNILITNPKIVFYNFTFHLYLIICNLKE